MSFKDASENTIDEVLQRAQQAFLIYRHISGGQKGEFLREIAAMMEAQRAEILAAAVEETHLPEPRLAGEWGRTQGQLLQFASLVEEGSWVEARIDTALPDRKPLPRPDIRKMMVPLGPVVVFGASNFPLAFSTAGGDTASALAAGCPVVVKGHPAHARTSQLVADAVLKAVKKCGLPDGVFAHVHGADFAVGRALVQHPLTQAVGFTGSYRGGKALYDLAAQREKPIPVFSEMGSVNPVFLLPGAVKRRPAEIAAMYAGSITLSAGQFCTNPGLLLGVNGHDMKAFSDDLAKRMQETAPAPMLHEGIHQSYLSNRAQALEQKGVELLAAGPAETSALQAAPTLATVALEDFLSNERLKEEVFGPYALLVQGNEVGELDRALEILPGQLTITVIGDEDDLRAHVPFIRNLREKAGRLIINGVPTGVEVCPAMHHGGPYPATTDARFTSVGTDAIKRWVRPVSFQNFPPYLLPDELQDNNPLGIWRLENNEWKK